MTLDQNAIVLQNQGQELDQVTHETVWLANFVSKHSKRSYQNAVRAFVAFHGLQNLEELRGIGPAHVIAWRQFLLDEGAAHRTVNARLSAISSLFDHLCEKQVVKENPIKGIKRPRVNRDRVATPVITPQQVRSILDAPDIFTLQGKRDAAFLHVLFYAGCRIIEAVNLRVRDFYEDGGYWVMDFKVKGGKQNRLAIHQELQVTIRRYLAEAGHGEDRGAYLFVRVRRPDPGKPLTGVQAWKIFRKYAKKADLPEGVTPHSARATFITQALEQGCPIDAVQRSVGHAHISTTQMYDKRGFQHRDSASFAVRY